MILINVRRVEINCFAILGWADGFILPNLCLFAPFFGFGKLREIIVCRQFVSKDIAVGEFDVWRTSLADVRLISVDADFRRVF